MTEAEKIAALKKSGWKEIEPGMWQNRVPFDYRDVNDPGKDDHGNVNRNPKTQEVIGRVHVVPEGVTRSTEAAFKIEQNRAPVKV